MLDYLYYLWRSLSSDDILRFFFMVFVFFGIISIIRSSLRKMKKVHSNWHQYFDTPLFTPHQFYEAVEKELEEQELPMVVYSRIYYPAGGIFSVNREYLRVKCREYVFDICAAPFAKGFFISWWMGELPDIRRDFYANMPWIGRLFRNRQKTFFELDNEALFKESVSHCVRKVFEDMSDTKGIRVLTDQEWQSVNPVN